MKDAHATRVFVGLGSNIRPHEHTPRALELLGQRFGPLRVSPAYRCPAVGFDGRDFVNLVAAFDATDNVYEVQRMLRAIETDCGRVRGARNKSRTMDIDLLLYGDAVIDEDELRLPRADILEYAFVLRPLSEIEPQRRHPVLDISYADLWQGFVAPDQPLTRIEIEGVTPSTF